VLLVGGCATRPAIRLSPEARAANDVEGNLVVRHLSLRYADPATTCHNRPTEPIFLCSGVMLRATRYSPDYHSWVPNPASPKGDGVSFSYIRMDAKFGKLAYGYVHGFIVYPLFNNPAPVVDLEILCAFPIDSDSDRRSADGCGDHALYPGASKPCQDQGIVTSDQWVAHYRAQGVVNRRDHQCGFRLVSGTPDSAALFMQLIGSMAELGPESFGTQNELIVGSWAATPNQIGVEAFFYLGGSNGLAESQKEQRDFYDTVHYWRPLIRMDLPASPAGAVTFSYQPSEQGVQ
jgi:hypothetical protein